MERDEREMRLLKLWNLGAKVGRRVYRQKKEVDNDNTSEKSIKIRTEKCAFRNTKFITNSN